MSVHVTAVDDAAWAGPWRRIAVGHKVGLAAALTPADAVSATYRGHGIALARGMSPHVLLSEVLGKSEGCVGGLGGSMHLADPALGLMPTFAIVGAGLPVACGAALAFQTQQLPHIAVAVIGDGGTNIGAFHESLNLAAIWNLPVLFVIDHNMYGEYSRWDLTTPIEDLSSRANSYAMPSSTIDGMEVEAVRAAVTEIVDGVRHGQGPYLLEAKTYRFSGHSRSDTAPYRPEGELQHWQARDPLTLARTALLAQGASAADVDRVESEATQLVRQSRASAEGAPSAPLNSMFEHVRKA